MKIIRLNGKYQMVANNIYFKNLIQVAAHPKKPVILFNIGYCYYLLEDKKKSIDSLSRCINEFNNIEQNKYPFDFYHRPNAIIKKIKIAKKMINILSAS